MVKGEDGRMNWTEFKYERLAEFCCKCSMMTHIDRNCKEKIGDYGRELSSQLRAS